MKSERLTDADIRELGWQALVEKLGPAGVPRVTMQKQTGYGDYSELRHRLLGAVSADKLIARMRTAAVGCHTYRHSLATYLLEDGYDLHSVQELLGDAEVRTAMIYTHVLTRGARSVFSPSSMTLRPPGARYTCSQTLPRVTDAGDNRAPRRRGIGSGIMQALRVPSHNSVALQGSARPAVLASLPCRRPT